MLDLATKQGIYEAARQLVVHLKDGYEDARGGEWTAQNFELLRRFAEENLGIKSEGCFYKGSEFLWDFLAIDRDKGVLIAAESEQYAESSGQQQDLLHDFEKLLYVYAPLRLLICKFKTDEREGPLLDSLQKYANGCCKHYNPGAVFIVFFGFWSTEDTKPVRTSAYLWQSEGDPSTPPLEDLKFDLI